MRCQKLILTNVELKNAELLQDVLSEIKGEKVKIDRPKILVIKKQLVETVVTNAKLALIKKLRAKYDIDKIYKAITEIFGLIKSLSALRFMTIHT